MKCPKCGYEYTEKDFQRSMEDAERSLELVKKIGLPYDINSAVCGLQLMIKGIKLMYKSMK